MAVFYRLEHRRLKYINPNSNVYVSPYNIDDVIDYNLYFEKYWGIQRPMLNLHAEEDGLFRPSPYYDGLDDRFDERYICGSPSIDDLKDWFLQSFDDWIDRGFVVREYIVNKIHIGNSGLQCIALDKNIKQRKIIKV